MSGTGSSPLNPIVLDEDWDEGGEDVKHGSEGKEGKSLDPPGSPPVFQSEEERQLHLYPVNDLKREGKGVSWADLPPASPPRTVTGEARAEHARRVRGGQPRGSRWAFTMHASAGANVLDKWDSLRIMGQEMDTAEDKTSPIRFICAQVEEGEAGGRDHIQGYVEFRSRKTLSQAKMVLGDNTAHLELAQGTPEQNVIFHILRLFTFNHLHLEYPSSYAQALFVRIQDSFFDKFEQLCDSDDVTTECSDSE